MNSVMNAKSCRMNALPAGGTLLSLAISSVIAVASVMAVPTSAMAQVRTKLPDRDTYNPVGPATPPPTRPTSAPVRATSGPDESGESFAGALRQLPLQDATGEIQPVNLRPLPSMVPRGKARVLALQEPAEE